MIIIMVITIIMKDMKIINKGVVLMINPHSPEGRAAAKG